MVWIKRTTFYLWPSGTDSLSCSLPWNVISSFPLMFPLGWREPDQAPEDEENEGGVGEQDSLFKESPIDLVYFLFQPNVHGILFLSNGIVWERFIFRLRSKRGIFKQKLFVYSKWPTLSLAFHINQIHYITRIWVYSRTSCSCKPNAAFVKLKGLVNFQIKMSL